MFVLRFAKTGAIQKVFRHAATAASITTTNASFSTFHRPLSMPIGALSSSSSSSRQFFTASALLRNNNQIIINDEASRNESIKKLKSDIAQLVDEELHDLEGEKVESEWSIYLKQYNYELKIDEFSVSLVRKHNDYSILITFDPQYEADQDEDETTRDEDEDDEADDEPPKAEGEEEDEQAYYVRSRPFALQVVKPNNEGLIMACIAGDDGRLYVQSITAGQMQAGDDPSITPSKFTDSGETDELKFHEISSKLQDRLYDWLEEDLEIDDGLAQFIQEYVESQKVQCDIGQLRSIKNFIA